MRKHFWEDFYKIQYKLYNFEIGENQIFYSEKYNP